VTGKDIENLPYGSAESSTMPQSGAGSPLDFRGILISHLLEKNLPKKHNFVILKKGMSVKIWFFGG
jgi:hypothetical protein